MVARGSAPSVRSSRAVRTVGENACMSIWVILYAIGAAQAAMLVPALWRRPANVAANRVLAAWLAVVCVDLAVKAIYLADPSATWFRAYRFVWLFPFLHGSLFYLYVRTLVSGQAPRARDAVHLAGFVLMAAITAPAWLGSPARIAWQFAQYEAGDWPPPLPGYDAILFAYGLSYVGAAIWRLHCYRRALRAQRSDADRWSLRWVEALALAQLVIWCIAVAHVALRLPGIDYFLIYAAVAVWVCVMGYFSLVQPPVMVAGAVDADAAPAREDGAKPDDVDAVAACVAEQDPRAPAVAARLSALMAEEALYRAPALTIGQLARRSGYPEYLVSAVINRRFGATFWEWINQLRVDAVRARLDDPAEARTLLDIAYDCGFTAKSTFNSAFKRRVGRTPSEYRRAALAGSSAQRQG
jgi:AraC-like DNA-binding protein